jgi:hypothetical protein
LVVSDGIKWLHDIRCEWLRRTNLRETFRQFDHGAARGRSIKITLLRCGSMECPAEKKSYDYSS